MNFSTDTLFIIDLAKRGGDMARTAFDPSGCEYDTKADNSPVTITDIAINQMIIDVVKAERPDWGVLGEELQWNSDAETLLVVDPIDGTLPFIWGVPVYGVMTALMHSKEIVSGVIHNPSINRTVTAEKGKGAFIVESQKQIFVSDVKDLQGQRVNVNSSTSYLAATLNDLGAKFMGLYSSAEVNTMIAKGVFVAGLFGKFGLHDIAAPKIIVEEAGGKVTDLDGNEHDLDQPITGVIVSNGHVHDQLLEIYKKSHNKKSHN